MTRGGIFRIAGVCGSGKTTIAALLAQQIREAGLPYRQVDTKEILCGIAGVRNEQEYREIPEEVRRTHFPLLTQRIAEIANTDQEQAWFFERHLCSMSENGVIIERGVPDEHGMIMLGVAVLVAHEEQILARRDQDRKVRRDRHVLSVRKIAEEQLKEIELALQARKKWGVPVRLFFNDAGQDLRVAKEILAFMQSISWQ